MNSIPLAKTTYCYVVTRNEQGQVSVAFNQQALAAVPFPSPGGLNFGYLGSGSAQLALTILCDFFQRHHIGNPPRVQETVRPFYQEFKRQFIAPEKGNCFTLGEDQVIAWLGQFRDSFEAIENFMAGD